MKYRGEKGWIKAYRTAGALWIHGGDSKQPHALLTSGNHSNGFFNSGIVTEHEELLSDAAEDLLDRFKFAGGNIHLPDVAVGPREGATKLAEMLSRSLALCTWASPSKGEVVGKKVMIFTEEEIKRIRGEHILLCEDVITTGGSIQLTVDAVERAGGIILPFVLALVNRSGEKEIEGRRIVALVNNPLPISVWTPEQCPLCREGSEAIRPKGENWARLNS